MTPIRLLMLPDFTIRQVTDFYTLPNKFYSHPNLFCRDPNANYRPPNLDFTRHSLATHPLNAQRSAIRSE